MIDGKWLEGLEGFVTELIGDKMKIDSEKYRALMQYPNVEGLFTDKFNKYKKEYPEKSDYEILIRCIGKYLDSVIV